MSVTFPLGFRATGVTAGLKPSGRPDLALLVADAPCAAAGVFTTNVFAAAPVKLSRARLDRGRAQAVLVNSGQANAGTGRRGDEAAVAATGAIAKELGVEPDLVLACSTGVIGEPIPMDRLNAAIPELAGGLSNVGGAEFAKGIMTTDTVAKQAEASAGPFRVGGCAKGVGMIAPDLATMLAFVTTDADVSPESLRGLVQEVVEPRFESLTVDGCTSTNDSVIVLASGTARGGPVTRGEKDWEQLVEAIDGVAASLVRQLAADAEGGTHVIEVDVSGAPTDADARVVAKAIAESMLVKTAVAGGDPNPGRILQAIGSCRVRVDSGRVSVMLGRVPVIVDGVIPPSFGEGAKEEARTAIKDREVPISVILGDGPGSGRAIGCDLTGEYVRINAEYTT